MESESHFTISCEECQVSASSIQQQRHLYPLLKQKMGRGKLSQRGHHRTIIHAKKRWKIHHLPQKERMDRISPIIQRRTSRNYAHKNHQEKKETKGKPPHHFFIVTTFLQRFPFSFINLQSHLPRFPFSCINPVLTRSVWVQYTTCKISDHLMTCHDLLGQLYSPFFLKGEGSCGEDTCFLHHSALDP